MTKNDDRIEIYVPEFLAPFVGETILAKANSIEFLYVLATASSVGYAQELQQLSRGCGTKNCYSTGW
jgi:hypothetical protein